MFLAVLLFSLAALLPTYVILAAQSVCDMTNSTTGSDVQDSHSSIELVSV